MKTVAQLLKHDFDKGPLYLYDSNNNLIYLENSNGFWSKYEYNDNGNEIYREDSNGYIIDNRPKSSCNGKVVEIDGKKYQLKEFV
jgi:hypothetical protein